RSKILLIGVVVEGSEAKVQTEEEVRRLSERLELGRRVVATRCRVVALWIRAAVLRVQTEIASREHEARVARARPCRPRLGQRQRRRHLAPFHERAGLEK